MTGTEAFCTMSGVDEKPQRAQRKAHRHGAQRTAHGAQRLALALALANEPLEVKELGPLQLESLEEELRLQDLSLEEMLGELGLEQDSGTSYRPQAELLELLLERELSPGR